MEINFRLDSDGRTSCPVIESDAEDNQGEQLDYSCKVAWTGLSNEIPLTCPSTETKRSRESIIDDLLFDCEILDFAILPRTFWISATGKVNT